MTAGEMPPKDVPHPPTADETAATVRDLISVHFDATDPAGFPADPEWHGFERLGSVLTLAPSTIEKYLTAGETILAEAYPATRPEAFEASRPAVDERSIEETHRERLREQSLLDKVLFEMWPGDIFRGSVVQSLPEAGIYEISYTLSGFKPANGRAPRLKVHEQQRDPVLFEQEIVAPEERPITVTFQAHLPKGHPTIHVVNDVPRPANTLPKEEQLYGREWGEPGCSPASRQARQSIGSTSLFPADLACVGEHVARRVVGHHEHVPDAVAERRVRRGTGVSAAALRCVVDRSEVGPAAGLRADRLATIHEAADRPHGTVAHRDLQECSVHGLKTKWIAISHARLCLEDERVTKGLVSGRSGPIFIIGRVF